MIAYDKIIELANKLRDGLASNVEVGAELRLIMPKWVYLVRVTSIDDLGRITGVEIIKRF